MTTKRAEQPSGLASLDKREVNQARAKDKMAKAAKVEVAAKVEAAAKVATEVVAGAVGLPDRTLKRINLSLQSQKPPTERTSKRRKRRKRTRLSSHVYQ